MLVNRNLAVGGVGVGGSSAGAAAGDCRSAAGSPFSSPSRTAGLPEDIRHFLAFVSKAKKDPAQSRQRPEAGPAAQAPAIRELFPVKPPTQAPPGKARSAALSPRTPSRRVRSNSVFAAGNLTPPSERALAAESLVKDENTDIHADDDEAYLNEDDEDDEDYADVEMTPTKPAIAVLARMRRPQSDGSDETDGEAVDVMTPMQADMACPTRREYRQHAQTHPKNEQSRYYCTFEGCGKSFCRGYSLKYHQYTHFDNAPFVCREPGCGKKFSHQSRLKRHEYSHHPDERSFPCDYPACGKRFSQKCHLKIHQQTHARKAASAHSGGDTSDGFISDV